MSAMAKTEETSRWWFLADDELTGGSDYSYMIYSSARTRLWSLHGQKKHGSTSPTTMAGGGDGAAVRWPNPGEAMVS